MHILQLKYILKSRFWLTIIIQLFVLNLSVGQTLVTSALNNSTLVPDGYYSYSGITMSTGFSVTPTGTDSYHFFIKNDLPGSLLTNFVGYQQTTVIKVAGISMDNQIAGLNSSQKQVTRQYFDGLGRTIQTVALQASPAGNDMIQSYDYDNLGRKTASYLPYAGTDASGNFRTNAMSDISNFYASGQNGKVVIDGSPFSQQLLENSPLQRLLQVGSVGDGYQPGQHAKSMEYRSNNVIDNVIIWNADGTTNGNYAVNTLAVQQVKDEQGITVQTFKNLDGKVILNRKLINETINGSPEQNLDTYYIYNDDGSIAYIVPPKAVAVMRNASNYNAAQTAVANLVFQFVYDSRSRLVQKSVPGGSVLYIVYDPLNRPVLLQDGNLRANNQWNYIKYDAAGRAISQGIYTDDINTTLATMQSYISGLNYSINFYESRAGSLTNYGYYTNNTFPAVNNVSPQTAIQPLAYSYYDDYDFFQNGNADYNYQSQGLLNEAAQTHLTRGMLTAISKTTIGAGVAANTWLMNVIFYDQQGHVIQTQSNNHTNTTGALTDIKTVVADFTGKIMQDKTVKVINSNTTTVLTSYTYDQSDRIKTIDQAYNGAAAIRIAAYNYNELGQMISKQLHSKDQGASFMQAVDYRYNIKGQLLTINNSTLTQNSNNNTSGSSAVFGMEFLYDKVDASSALNNTPYFNGLLSAVKWMVKTNTLNERSYKFDYDDQNRIVNANYADRAGGSGAWVNGTAYDEKNISYDYNGNILTLQRNAMVSGSIQPVDNLQYNYNGNRLNTVTDGSGGNYASLGFKNITGSTSNYVYDANGNVTNDPYKGMSLNYNILNRTNQITITTGTGQYINYTYDATGILIRKQQYNNGSLTTTTDYVDGFVIVNGSLSYFPMAEGRIVNTGASLKPEYVITDQQGNARLSFQEQQNTGVVALMQENSYYPFGLLMPNSAISTPALPNNNLYNGGSEWQNDYGNLPDLQQTYYRNYDAALGRFIGVDPKAEAAPSMGSYQYAGNNPVMYNDPLGDVTSSGNVPKLLVPQEGGGGGWDAIPGFYDKYYNALGEELAGMLLPWQERQDKRAAKIIREEGVTYTYEWSNHVGNVDDGTTANSHSVGGYVLVTQSNATEANQGGVFRDANLDVDSRTLGGNIFWNNYSGPWNPKDNQGNWSYKPAPTNRADFGAMLHDKDYDHLHITGASGLFTNASAIGADYTLVGYELDLFASPYNLASPTEKIEGLIIGIGVGVSALPKTLTYGVGQLFYK